MKLRRSSCGARLVTLPECLIIEILQRLNLESICSVACVARPLYATASLLLASFSTLNLMAFSLDERSFNAIANKVQRLKIVTIDCLQLTDLSVIKVLGPHIQELTLLKGSSLSPRVLMLICDRCPNLRVLLLELTWKESSENLIRRLDHMTRGLTFLESLSVKIRGSPRMLNLTRMRKFFLPETLRDLKLQLVHDKDVIDFIRESKKNRSVIKPSTCLSTPILQHQPVILLQHLTLVLNIISDELVRVIVHSLPKLIELNLEDRPCADPLYPRDLTNFGLQKLGSSQRLSAISIVRSKHHYPASFKLVTNMGMFFLSEGCQDLKSVTLGGFSAVTDVGFSSFLQSCRDLKKFEIRHASFLSDLTFHDMSAVKGLVELRIVSCDLITSKAISQLNSSMVLEVLDTSGSRSIGDTCLNYISGLQTLTTLNLSGAADVTDKGLAILSDADLPITHLCLRDCRRVSDRGIANLFVDGGKICKTLTSLDLGHMSGITDRAFTTIASSCESLKELCIRYCYSVTDSSLEILAAMRRFHGGNGSLQKLDLYYCLKLSSRLIVLLQKHTFPGLKWVGAGRTFLEGERDSFANICMRQPWLTVCFDGCEMGCRDGWQFHERVSSQVSPTQQSHCSIVELD